MNLCKKNIVVLVIAVLVVAGVGFLINKNKEDRGYSVVYMTTGEVYIGKLSTFPDLQLKDAYLYQVTKDANDQTKANFQLQPLKDALWAPKVMHLVKDNISFYGPLMSDSKIAQTLAEQKK